jgi:hypothetical protein
LNPFFFGTSEKQLFGIHHPPETDEVRDGAVLLCPALGHEYIASHSSLQQLGNHLARAGIHALRFDYYGSGDSAGDMEGASVEQWIADIATAVQELKDTSGSKRVCVAGLRLGAALAAIASARAHAAGDDGIFATVLWEPVVHGPLYLEELAQIQNLWMEAMYLRPPRHLQDSEGPETLGFRVPQSIQNEIRSLDLMELPARPAERILIVQNTDGGHLEDLKSRLSVFGNGVAHEMIPAPKAWMGHHWGTIALPAVEVLRRITKWVAEVYQ